MRWNCGKRTHQESPLIDAFLDEIKQVCLRHGLTLEPEGYHGSLNVEICRGDIDVDWLMSADIGLSLEGFEDRQST
jgi:hypothetical protein